MTEPGLTAHVARRNICYQAVVSARTGGVVVGGVLCAVIHVAPGRLSA
jgi:hypothetical protein